MEKEKLSAIQLSTLPTAIMSTLQLFGFRKMVKLCLSVACLALFLPIVYAQAKSQPVETPPGLISPIGSTTVTSQEVLFSWTNVSAIRYDVYVDNNSSFESPEVSPVNINFLTQTTTSYQLSGNWLGDQSYYWKVIAHYPNGSTSESSPGIFIYSPTKSLKPFWVPIYRAYHDVDVDHFYCTSESHLNVARNNNYRFEKVDGYISIVPFQHLSMVPLYRFYVGQDKSHFYTSSNTVRDSKIRTGWIYEGITGYGYSNPIDSTIPMYYAYLDNPVQAKRDHFYTSSSTEINNVMQRGYSYIEVSLFVSPFGNKPTLPWRALHPNAGVGVNTQNGNFTYSDNPISIASRGLSIDFWFSYNSLAALMPTESDPLGPGWTHSYYSYAYEINNRIYVHWSDGSIHEYHGTNLQPITAGVYDILSRNGNYGYEIKTKQQITYSFVSPSIPSLDTYPAVLASIRDRNDNMVTCNYEISGERRLVSIASPDGRLLTLTYRTTAGRTHQIARVSDPENQSISFDYDSSGNLMVYTDAQSHTTSFTYDPDFPEAHLLIQVTRPLGNKIVNTFQSGKVASQQFGGRQVLLTYDGPTTTVTTGNLQNTYYFNQDINGLPAKIIHGSSLEQLFFENPTHPTLPSRAIDGNGNTTFIGYDSRGNITRIDRPLNVTDRFEYNSFNDVSKHINPRGKIWEYSYDADGNLQSIKEPRGGTWYFGRNSYGLPHTITDPGEKVHNLSYNGYGLLESVTDALGNRVSFAYDALSRMTELRDARFNRSQFAYSPDNVVRLITDPSAGITQYQYDVNHNLTTVINALNKSFMFGYNDRDQLSNRQWPSMPPTQYRYELNGLLESRTDPNGQTTRYSYDAKGRLTGISYPAASTVLLGYDDNDNITSVSDDNGSMDFSYDALNRLITHRDYWNNTVAYQYDAAGNMETIIYPGGKSVTYTYTDDNLLSSVQDWNNKTTEYTYRKDGLLDELIYPNGIVTHYTYDIAGRMIGMSTKKSDGAVICEYQFTLDGNGNHTAVKRTEPLLAPATIPLNVNYAYDDANRMISAGSTTLTHDNNGNLTSRSDSSTTMFSYDIENRLVEIVGRDTVIYMYDVFGNRRYAKRNGHPAWYVLDITGKLSNVLMEKDSSGTPISSYVYGLGLISRIQSDGITTYYHGDYRGSVVAMTNQSQTLTHSYSYGPFGNLLSSQESDVNTFRYIGQYGVTDEGAGLTYMRTRYYFSDYGIFNSEDRLWNLNLYSYANSNPTTKVDPLGLKSSNINEIVDPGLSRV